MDVVKKNEKDKPLSVIRKTSIALLVIICLIIFVRLISQVITREKLKNEDPGVNVRKGIEDINEYYNPVPAFGASIPVPYSYPPFSKTPSLIPGTCVCNFYTYESFLHDQENGSSVDIYLNPTPRLNSVFLDYVNGLNHTGGGFGCVSSDQIEAINVERQCLDTTKSFSFNNCYTPQGEKIKRGNSYSYPSKCSSDIPPCKGVLGVITLNYKLNNSTNGLDKNVVCLSIEGISVPTSIYNNPTYNFYKPILNSTGEETATTYPIQLTSARCDTKNSRQKFLITSFKYGPHIPESQEGEQDQETVTGFYVSNLGMYKSIIYKPLNAYLDVDTANSDSTGTKFILRPISNSEEEYPPLETIKWILPSAFNPSINRYPTLQRCNYIVPATSDDKYFLNSSQVKDNALFVKSYFKLNNTNPADFVRQLPVAGFVFSLQIKENYCSDKRSSQYYPKYVFKNTTPGCVLNPFLFYDYSVSSSDGGNPPVQGSEKPFYLSNPGNPKKLNYGEKILDGTCELEVVNYDNSIVEFPGEYFTSTSGGIIQVNGSDNSNSSLVVNSGYYQESSNGLISSVEINKEPSAIDSLNKNVFETGSFPKVKPISQTNSNGDSTPGSGAIFDLTIKSVFDNKTKVNTPNVSGTVFNPGKDYSVGDLLTFNASDIGMSDYTNPVLRVFSIKKEDYIFRAFPMNSENQITGKIFSDNSTDFPIRDFSFIGSFDNSNGLEQKGIISSGFNYSINTPVYVIQLDINTETPVTTKSQELLTESIIEDTSGLIQVTPTNVSDNKYSGNTAAPISLLPSSSSPPQFNFLAGSKMGLSPCNPQLIYGGENYLGTSNLIETFVSFGINDITGLQQFFLSDKTGGRETNVIFLKSLQYNDIKYSTTENNIIVSNPSDIVLGKFIPYSSFTPVTGSNSNPNEPPTEAASTLYNGNYFGFIPYGQTEIYNTSFLVGFNN